MIDLPAQLAADVHHALMQEMQVIEAEVLNGRVTDMERYKFLMGQLEGLRIATRVVADALKKARFDDEE